MTRSCLLLAARVALIGVPLAAHAPVKLRSSPADQSLQSARPASVAMTNQDVINMVAAGLEDDVIVTAIRQAAARNFDVTVDGLIALKQGKVPGAIIRTMQATAGDVSKAIAEQKPAATSPPGGAVVSSTRSASLAPTVAPQEPNTLGELFVITPATGAPTPLERAKLKDKKSGPVRSQGIFKPDVQMYVFYVDGALSPIAFRSGEPQVFAIRLISPGARYGLEATAEEMQRRFALWRLDARDGKRFVTTTGVPLDAQRYGQPTRGLDGKQGGSTVGRRGASPSARQDTDRLAVSFQLTPHVALPPGEYVVSLAGVRNFELLPREKLWVNNRIELVTQDLWVFRIVEP